MYERITHMHEELVEEKTRYFFPRKVSDKEFLFTYVTRQPNKKVNFSSKFYSEQNSTIVF